MTKPYEKQERCPCCGAKAKLKFRKTDTMRIVATIICSGCLLSISRFCYQQKFNAREIAKSAAITAWNRRTA